MAYPLKDKNTLPSPQEISKINRRQTMQISKNFIISRKTSHLKEKKSQNPFEIQDEDKIFSELQQKRKKMKKKKKKIKYISINDKILSKVYRNTPKLQLKIIRIKKQKSNFPLREYQEILLNTVSNNLSRESTMKLGKSFTILRNSVNKRYETNYDYLKEVEEKEEKIYNRINYKSEMFHRNILKNQNEEQKKYYFNLNYIKELPKIKFEKIIK